MFDPNNILMGRTISGNPILRDSDFDEGTVDLVTKKISKAGKQPIIFKNYQDTVAYQTKKKRYPVVKKVRSESGDPKDDVFQLVGDFKTLQEARDWIFDPDAGNKRRNYIIWYDPKVLL